MWIILQRELWVRLRDLRFWIGVFSFPLLISAVLGVTYLLKREKRPISLYLVSDKAWDSLLGGHPRFLFLPIEPEIAPQRKAALQPGEGLLELTEHASTHITFTLYSREALSDADQEQLKQLLQQAIQQLRVRELGLSPEQWAYLNPQLSLQSYLLKPDEKAPQSASLVYVLSFAVSVLMYLILSAAGFQILLSVLEEKTNRLAEYLAISVPVADILTAKLLAGLLLAFLRGGVLVLFILGGGWWLQQGVPKLSGLLASLNVPWGWLLAYLLVGVLLYAFLYAAAGASSDSVTELSGLAQVMQWAPTLLFMLIVLLWQNGPAEGQLVWRLLSYFPLTAPIAMPARLLNETVPLWENLFALSLVVLSAWGARRLGARLYKHALFLYGQKLSWRSMWTLLRERK